MLHKLRLLSIVLVIFTSSYFAFSALFPKDDRKNINLGLDLRGGISLLMEVGFENYTEKHLESLLDQIKPIIEEDTHIKSYDISANDDSLMVYINNDEDNIKIIIDKISKEIGNDYQILSDKSKITLQPRTNYMKKLKDQVVSDTISNIRKRVDELGTKEISIVPQGKNNISLQIPGVFDTQEVREILGKTAALSFHLLAENNANTNNPTLHAAYDDNGNGYLIKKRATMTGEDLSYASHGSNQKGGFSVYFKLNDHGKNIFAKVTKENSGKRFAIVLDDTVLSAPLIREPITGGSGEISGSFTKEEAEQLSILLRSGALPAPLTIIEERTVGSSLGQDTINQATKAAFISIILVTIFMILSYGLFGVISSFALLINIVMIIALVSVLGITLTLPGIAGIVLTMGMSVDANVLIFERIREELESKTIIVNAIRKGFKRAIITIWDSNITTLISALLMFIVGTGPIKGFAVTLSMGILCSMFTAIVLSREIIMMWLKYKKPKSLLI